MKTAKTYLVLGMLTLALASCAGESKKSSGGQRKAAPADDSTNSDNDPIADDDSDTGTSPTCPNNSNSSTSGSGLTDLEAYAQEQYALNNANPIFDTVGSILQCIRDGGKCLTDLGGLGGLGDLGNTGNTGNTGNNPDLICFNGQCFDKFGKLVSTATGTGTNTGTGTSIGTSTGLGTSTTFDPCAEYTWSEMRLIFEISCNSCHAHTNQYTSEEIVRGQKSAIMTSLQNGSMPQYPTQLDANSKAKLLHYLGKL